MTDEFTVQWTPTHGRSRKLVFERRPDEPRWARIEFELRESRWHEVGLEYLDDVSVTGTGVTDLDGGDTDE